MGDSCLRGRIAIDECCAKNIFILCNAFSLNVKYIGVAEWSRVHNPPFGHPMKFGFFFFFFPFFFCSRTCLLTL